MIYIIFLIFIVVYWKSPLPVQIILLVANAFVPDMIPVVDELLMTVAVIDRVRNYVKVRNFIRVHKILTILIVVGAVAGIILGIQWLMAIV